MGSQKIINTELLLKKMEEKDISKYKLHKLTGLNEQTVYAYFSGRLPIPQAKCRIMADAIGCEVSEVFPQLKTIGPETVNLAKDATYDARLLRDKVKQVTNEEIENIENKNYEVTVNDMIAGSSTLTPVDGLTLQSRKVVNHLCDEYDAMSVQPETQVTIKTGIKANNINLNKVVIKSLKKDLIENECHVNNTAFNIDGELCIVLYVHGKPLMIYKGKEVAQITFVK